VLSSWYEELKVANTAFHNTSSRSRSSALSLPITVICVVIGKNQWEMLQLRISDFETESDEPESDFDDD
jgi:hypothetical protein